MIEQFHLGELPEVSQVYSVTRRTVWQISDPRHILLYIRDGSCSVEFDGEKHTLTPGSLLLIPAESAYLRTPIDDRLCVMYYIHFRLPSASISEVQARQKLLLLKEQINTALLSGQSFFSLTKELYLAHHTSLLPQHQRICTLFDETIRSVTENRFYGVTQASVLASHLLLLAANATAESLLDEKQLQFSGNIPEKLHRAILFIQQHYSEKIGLDSLCRHCSVSPQQMIRYFHAFLDTTPNAYIIRYKMNKAHELLLNAPHMSVKEVSAELGFDDQCYFSRMFTKYTGRSPTEYRTHLSTFDEKKHIQETPPPKPKAP